MKTSPTIIDIAARAGVSKSTVSRVLRNAGAISAESRAKVERAACELGYSPNAIAQAMKTHRTGTIAFWLCGGYQSLTADPFYAHVIEGVIRRADEVGLDLLLNASTSGGEPSENRLLRKRVDGVLLASFASDETIEAFCKRDIPVVLVNFYKPDARVCCVTMNDYENTVEEMELLLHRGHRQIAFICGSLTSYSHSERLRAYRDALARHGIPFDERLIRIDRAGTGSALVSRGRELMEELLRSGLGFSAALVVNDYMTAGAMQAIRAAGKRIPQDLALMGYDDLECAAFLEPPLTTYAIDEEQLGMTAVDLLLARMDGKSAEQHKIIPGNGVVLRDSV